MTTVTRWGTYKPDAEAKMSLPSNCHFKEKTDTYTIQEGAPLIAQLVKNLPAMQETLVQFLGQEDPLEKG